MSVMSRKLSNSLMEASKSDFEVTNILIKNSYYSQSIYHFQQAFEKAIKALYCHYRIKYDKINEVTAYNEVFDLGHDTKKSSLDLLIMITKKHPKWLLRQISNQEKRRPEYQNLIPKLFTMTSTFVQSLERMKVENNSKLPYTLQKYPKFVERNYSKFKRMNEPYMQSIASKISIQQGLSNNNLSKESYLLLNILRSSLLLYPCLVQMESISRYPLEQFQFKNINILNSKEMAIPCSQISEIVDVLISSTSEIVRL
jgi:HEPN domain-containing protein